MTSRLLALLAAAVPLIAGAQMEMSSRTLQGALAARVTFRAPLLKPIDIASLPAPLEKLTGVDAKGREIAGPVRLLPKATRVDAWRRMAGGFVSRLHVASAEAEGLRVKLELGPVPGAIEARVQGNDGRIYATLIDRTLGPEAWTPWTEGAEQVIELFSPVLPSANAVNVTAVLHVEMSVSATTKAAADCTVNTMCTTNDPVLDSAIAERKTSVAKMQFVEGTHGFICTGTLLNSDRFPAAFFLTANHCISNATVAASLTTLWFYESTSCEGGLVNPNMQQVAGGATLVFTNYNVDSTLLQLNFSPPGGAAYSSWTTAELGSGAPIVSISHPTGDTSRYALGTIAHDFRFDRPQNFYGVLYSRGIIQGGSSGSGLFQLSNGTLKLAGTLFGSTVHGTGDGLSCTNLNEDGLYGRFSIFGPEITQYLGAARAADDAPNRVQDFAGVPDTSTPLDQASGTLSFNGKRIDYAGDLDLFRFNLQAAAYVSAWTEGTQDTVGSILNSDGTNVITNDDAQFTTPSNYNMGITQKLDPGTYYVQVGHYDATGTAAYNFKLRADLVSTNYTDLWYNAAESAWGVNVNHQGNILFATLFTYGPSGTAVWYSMSSGVKQPDGSYLGDLARTTGPAFNAVPFAPAASATKVGTMRFTFTDDKNGVLAYSVGGVQVTKNISRISLATAPTCTWSAFDRSGAGNFQDLWWNSPAGSENGWGVNITHQGNTLFATLFTYDSAGQPMWLVMSNGTMSTAGNYSGGLLRTTGPAFNAVPFTPITPANYTQVGTMSFAFTNGNTGTMTYTVNGASVTKQIERLVFGALKTECSSN